MSKDKLVVSQISLNLSMWGLQRSSRKVIKPVIKLLLYLQTCHTKDVEALLWQIATGHAWESTEDRVSRHAAHFLAPRQSMTCKSSEECLFTPFLKIFLKAHSSPHCHVTPLVTSNSCCLPCTGRGKTSCASLHREQQDRQEAACEASPKHSQKQPPYVFHCVSPQAASLLPTFRLSEVKPWKGPRHSTQPRSVWFLPESWCVWAMHQILLYRRGSNTSTQTRNGMFSRFQTMLSHFGLPPLWLFPLELLSSPKSIDPHCASWLIGADTVLCLSPKLPQWLTVHKILPLLVNLPFGRLPRLKQFFLSYS